MKIVAKIEAWLLGLLRGELTRVENAAKENATALEARLDKFAQTFTAGLESRLAALETELKQFVTAEVERPLEEIKQHISSEIVARYEAITRATGVAAREALADARRTLRMPCDICHLMSWKFIVDEDGKVICHDCRVKTKGA